MPTTVVFSLTFPDDACCDTCVHFDGDSFCTLMAPKLIPGFIREPELVLCAKFEPLPEGE